jgi:hypothetical protein
MDRIARIWALTLAIVTVTFAQAGCDAAGDLYELVRAVAQRDPILATAPAQGGPGIKPSLQASTRISRAQNEWTAVELRARTA